MPLGLPQYIMPNARVRSMIGRLLSEDEWRQLYQARDLPGMLAILRETTYAPQLAEFENSCPPCELLEAKLNANVALRFARVIDLTPQPGKDLVIIMKQLYEVDNLKAIMRGLEASEAAESVLPFLFPLGRAASFDVDRLLAATDIPDLVARLQGTPYGDAMRHALVRYERERSLFPLEVALDLDYHQRLWRAVQALKGEDRHWADLLIGTLFDIVNIMWALRYRYYYHLSMVEIINYTLPYGRRSSDAIIRAIAEGEDVNATLRRVWGDDAPTVHQEMKGWLSMLEVDLYRYLSRLARGALVGYPFHLGVILACLLLKRFEVHDLMVLAEAKMASLRRDEYRQYMIHEV